MFSEERAHQAIAVMTFMVHSFSAGPIHPAAIAEHLAVSRRVLFPVLTALTEAGLLEKQRAGGQWGYRIKAASPGGITVAAVLEAVAGDEEAPVSVPLSPGQDLGWPLLTALRQITLEDLWTEAEAEFPSDPSSGAS